MIRLTLYFPYINIIAQSKKCFVFLQFAFPVLTNCNVIYIYIKAHLPQSLCEQGLTGPLPLSIKMVRFGGELVSL